MDPKNSNQITPSSSSDVVPRSLPPLPKVSPSAELVQKNVEISPPTSPSISEKLSSSPTSPKTIALSSKNEDNQSQETSPSAASDSSKTNIKPLEKSQKIPSSNQVSTQNRSFDFSGLSKPLKSRLDRRLSINIIRHEIIQDKKPYTVIDESHSRIYS
jgi:hypothetical protein